MYDGRTLHAREAIEILEENFGDLVYGTRIRKTVRYAEAPVKGSSVLRYDPTGPGRPGVPRSGEGGARWRASARACVRARSPSSSARPRRRSARRRRAGADRAARDRARGRARAPGGARGDGRARSTTSRRPRRRIVADAAAAPTPRAAARPTEEAARRSCRLAGGRTLLPDDARAGARAPPRAAAEGRRLPRRDPRRRRRRRRPERRPPHDGRGNRAGRLHRRQHGHAGARDLRRPDQDLTSARG